MADKFVPGTDPMKSDPRRGYSRPWSIPGTEDTVKGYFSEPENIKEWLRPRRIDEAVHEKDEPDDTNAYAGGGEVQTRDPMPPDQRKLADRINVNELMQMQDDKRAGGWGTSRDLMPPPPQTPSFNKGGMVKHGSSTRVTCRSKHG